MSNHTQHAIAQAVAARGYLDGWTDDQLAARQLVKQLEEVCEAMQALHPDDTDLYLLVDAAKRLGHWARAVFDAPSSFDGVTVDLCVLADELPDLVVPIAVLAHALSHPDMMEAGLRKAVADVARGVR